MLRAVLALLLLAPTASAQVPPPPAPPVLQWEAGPVYTVIGGTVAGGDLTIPAVGSDYSAADVTATGSTTARTAAARPARRALAAAAPYWSR